MKVVMTMFILFTLIITPLAFSVVAASDDPSVRIKVPVAPDNSSPAQTSTNFPPSPVYLRNIGQYGDIVNLERRIFSVPDPKLDLSCALTNPNLALTKNCVSSLRHQRLGIIDPIFTQSAYQSRGFYAFYKLFPRISGNVYVRQNLTLLNVSVINSWGSAAGLFIFVQKLESIGWLDKSTPIMTDVDVNSGALFFQNGTRRYDVLVLGFSEYVTSNEYNSYEQFVRTGGILVLLNSCNFIAQVNFNAAANKISLVSGHGWNFNGSAAWKGPDSRWAANNTNWIGSGYKLFYTAGYTLGDGASIANNSNVIATAMKQVLGNYTIFQKAYSSHEEDVLTNSSDTVIAYWDLDNYNNQSQIVAMFSHPYQGGVVIGTGIFGSDIIAFNLQMQFFILASILAKTS